MQKSHRVKKAVLGFTLDRILKYVDKDPQRNMQKLVKRVKPLFSKIFPPENFNKMYEAVSDSDNVWAAFGLNIINDLDRGTLRKLLMTFGIDAGLYGTKTVRANREKYKCNIPFLLLFDPTSACNLHCKGCWSAEYGHKLQLSFDEMQSIVSQGKALGTHLYMMTGGEPLIRKDDIIKLCENNPDCIFLAYTNATLIDEKLCREMNRVGNLSLALSIEGDEESNDWRRGEGSYQTTVKAMDLLKKNKCFFGVSVCYTRRNVESVTSDSFMDMLVEKGAKFALYFNYMPVGHTGTPELIPTSEQRTHMYKWLKVMRNGKTGKPIFVMDFQNDAEYVGGCIAGGRNYFHINSAGDMEPCVFVHYSDSNIREKTLLEALKSPLFMAYHKGQPFNDNHLRPCPMLENPDILREMIKKTNAKSSDLINQEDVDTLCDKCVDFATDWAPKAEALWNSTKHRETHTQYYRDTPEGKAELSNKEQ